MKSEMKYSYTANAIRPEALLGSTLQPRMVNALSTNTADFPQVNSLSEDSGIPNL